MSKKNKKLTNHALIDYLIAISDLYLLSSAIHWPHYLHTGGISSENLDNESDGHKLDTDS